MSSMADRRDPRGDALLRAFARDLAKMRRDLRNLEAANQISSASIEGGTLDVYDDDDVLRERIGKQANGSYGRLVLEGPPPPVPSEPDVQVIADGVVAITWDGRCEEKWPFVEFRNVRIHLVEDPVNEVCDRDNQVGAIFAHRGGTILAVTESDDDNPVYARLVAVSSAGHVSDPSPAVLVDELDEEDLAEEEEELEWEDGDGRAITQAEVDAGEVVLSLSHDPEVESLTAVLAGVPQRADKFTIDFDAQTLTLSLSGWEKAGDVLWVHYPYMAGEVPAPVYPLDAAWITRSGGNMTIHVHWAIPPTTTTTMALTIYQGSTAALVWSFDSANPNVPAGTTETTFDWTDIPGIDGLHVGIGYTIGAVEGTGTPAYNKPYAWNNPDERIYWFGPKSYDNGDPNDTTDEPFAPIGPPA